MIDCLGTILTSTNQIDFLKSKNNRPSLFIERVQSSDPGWFLYSHLQKYRPIELKKYMLNDLFFQNINAIKCRQLAILGMVGQLGQCLVDLLNKVVVAYSIL